MKYEDVLRLLLLARQQSSGGVIQTLSGNLPLSFTAIAKSIVSLIQFGKIEQATTPAPATPANIVCNNGTLTLVDDELPIGYRRIASIEFSGNTYYETQEKLYGTDTVTISLSDFVSSGQNLFGCYAGAEANNFSLYIYGTPSGQSYWRYGQNLYRPVLGGTTDRTITFGAGGTTGFKTDVSYPTVDFESESTARIGALPNSTSAKYDGTIVGNITVSNRLKYIPCERTSDGVIGYYEMINGVFLEPQGNAPVAGAYDVTHNHLEVVGTPEVLTVGSQTASAVDLYAVGDYQDTQDIISGAVTRNVGIQIFDGTEDWTLSSTYFCLDNLFTDAIPYSADSPAIICSHFTGRQPSTSESGMVDGDIKLGDTSVYNRVYLKYAAATTADELKAFLAAQYAAGTPVIVLYPLAEAITEAVQPQPLNTSAGTNTIDATAEVSDIPVEIEFYQAADSSLLGSVIALGL